MTAGRYAAGDGSFAKSAGGAAARGGVLIAVAVALGLIILNFAYDGGDESAVVPGDSSADDATSDDGGGTGTDDGSADDGSDGDGDGSDDGSDGDGSDGGDGTDTTTTLPTTPSTNLPGDVKVVVANGVGETGLAGTVAAELTTAGYVASDKNATGVPVAASVVYYVDGYAADAAAVAEVLAAPASVVQAAPPDVLALVSDPDDVADHHVFAILGEDRLLG